MLSKGKTIDQMLSEMVKIYEEEYSKQTNSKKILKAADAERIEIYTFAAMYYQLYELIEYNTRMNFIKYATGEFLDELGVILDVKRLPAQCAKTMVKIKLSKKADDALIIPLGTRVSAGTNLFFSTTKMIAIEAGQEEIVVPFEANIAGKVGNGFLPGQINVLVDRLPFVSSVENTEETRGGADLEDDESLRRRIILKPTGLSVAGPEKAYQYFVYSYSQLIADVRVSSPSPGVVDIRILLENGELPSQNMLDDIETYLVEYRPMTDKVIVEVPEVTYFDIDLTYYIATSKLQFMEDIKVKVNEEITKFQQKQRNSIGKNIVPDELIKMCLDAGAYRAEIRSPIFTQINNMTVAHLANSTVIFGGVVDD